MTDKQAEIVIIGGGLAGLTTAWSLQKEGYSGVTILEKGPRTTMEASGLNAGLIRHFHESPRIRTELRRGISLLQSYQERHNTSFFEQRPSLWYVPEEMYFMLEKEAEEQLQWRRVSDSDVPAQYHTEEDEDRCWIFFEEDALLNSVELGKLLRWEVERSSVTVSTESEVASGTRTEGGWELTLGNGESMYADRIVNAAGAWANEVGDRLGLERSGMTPVPRQLFLVENDLVPDSLSYVMDLRDRIVLRRMENGALVSFAGEADGPESEPSESESDSDDQLKTVIGKRFPGLNLSPINTYWSGYYAKTEDRKPIIEPDPNERSVIWATGLNDYGLSYGFHVGEKVLEFL